MPRCGLGAASLVFYGAWDERFVLLLLASVVFNYGAGLWIARQRSAGRADLVRHALITAVAADLALLLQKWPHSFRQFRGYL